MGTSPMRVSDFASTYQAFNWPEYGKALILDREGLTPVHSELLV